MTLQSNIAIALLGSALALAGQAAHAEAAYGYQSSGTGAVSASAKVNIKINVPKLILLRVGSDNTTVDTVAFDVKPSWVTAPGALVSGASSNNTPWDRNAPSFTASPTTAGSNILSASAWTNAPGATLSVTTTTAMSPATGPGSASITVSSGAGLAHPGGAGATLATTATTAIPAGAVANGTWTYDLNPAGVASWAAGTYNATVTYTASAL